MNLPFVSIVTPTYNRRRFIPILIKCVQNQDYKGKIEWVILDDGTDPVEDLFKGIPYARYVRMEEKKPIGFKRNRLNDLAKGEIIVCMDDDDYYPPDRVKHVITRFSQQKHILLAGSSIMYMYYTDDKTLVSVGPYGKYHATNGTLAYRKKYSNENRYDDDKTHAEEKSFLKGFSVPMIQLDPLKTILVISHNSNTFDKKKFRDKPTSNYKKTQIKLKNFIKDKDIREFYENM